MRDDFHYWVEDRFLANRGCSSGVERDLAKVEAMSSRLIIRSNYFGCARAKAMGQLGVYGFGIALAECSDWPGALGRLACGHSRSN